MTDFKSIIDRVAGGNVLNDDEAYSAFNTIMSGEATPGQIGAFLMALRVRGEARQRRGRVFANDHVVERRAAVCPIGHRQPVDVGD